MYSAASIGAHQRNTTTRASFLLVASVLPCLPLRLFLLAPTFLSILHNIFEMSTRRTSNRKRKALTQETTLLDPDLAEADPKDLAQQMLGWLPEGSSLKSPDAQKLLKSFDLVRVELQHRTNLLATESIATGRESDVTFCFGNDDSTCQDIVLPADAFQRILAYTPFRDRMIRLSLVSKVWLANVRAPQLNHTLDFNHGLFERSKTVLNMDHLLSLIRQPHFASLKKLVPPNRVQMRKKALSEIAAACPKLESLNLGFSSFGQSKMKCTDELLLNLPTLFPYLKHLKYDTEKITREGLAEFCRRMGERLSSLHIDESYRCPYKLTEGTLSVIAEHCPNLQEFEYHDCYRGSETILTAGIIDILRRCRGLKRLTLFNFEVPTTVLAYIADEGNNLALERLYIVGCSALIADVQMLRRLKDAVAEVYVLESYEHYRRVKEIRRANGVPMPW